MARKCKCKICGKDLTTDIAYNIPKVMRGSRIKNQYYCSKEEYDTFEYNRIRQLELLRENQKIFDSIIGYECINNTKNREFSKLYEIYTREEIKELLLYLKEDIIKALNLKGDCMNEYQRIRYIFSIINNHAKDFFDNKRKRTQDISEYEDIDDNVEVEVEVEIKRPSIRKKKVRKGLLDIL